VLSLEIPIYNDPIITGYGNLVPTSDSSRIFTCFYVLFGLACVLTSASDFAKYTICRMQDHAIACLYSLPSPAFKAVTRVGLCAIFLLIGVLIGTVFFAVNEGWTGAESFYWTIMTMTVSSLLYTQSHSLWQHPS
jgi:Ion channel